MGKIHQLIRSDSWRPWALAGLLAVVSSASVFSLDAWARDAAATSSASAASGVHDGHHGHRPAGGPPDGIGLPLGGPHLDRLLTEVQATDAQRSQIKALAQTAEADLKPLHEQERSLHEQTLALFGQQQLDATAAEKLRQQVQANHDAASKRFLQAALDIGKVLTPDQRIALVAKVQKRHEWMKAHHEEHARLEQ